MLANVFIIITIGEEEYGKSNRDLKIPPRGHMPILIFK